MEQSFYPYQKLTPLLLSPYAPLGKFGLASWLRYKGRASGPPRCRTARQIDIVAAEGEFSIYLYISSKNPCLIFNLRMVRRILQYEMGTNEHSHRRFCLSALMLDVKQFPLRAWVSNGCPKPHKAWVSLQTGSNHHKYNGLTICGIY